MGDNHMAVAGITPPAQFPKCPHGHPYTQFCEIDRLYIPCPNPSIHKVLEVCVSVIICSIKEICTPVGKKLVIHGKKKIKVKYEVKDHCDSVYVAQFEIPFCTFIELGDIKREIVRVCTAIEDITVQCLDSRHLTVSSIIFICPEFKKEHDWCPHPPKEHDCQCDCQKPHKKTYDESDSGQNPYEQDYDQYQPSEKKYYSVKECPGCGIPEVIRIDPHYYYGK